MLSRSRVALVTGSSRGIGLAVARRLADDGLAVVINSRSAADSKEAAEEIRKAGGDSISISADLSSPHECRTLIETAVQELGRLDVLINNAGTPGPQVPVEACELRDWVSTLNVNLTAPFLLIRAAIPHLKEHGQGRIINISSGAGIQPMVNSGPYGVSKAGLIMLTRILSAELAAEAVKVNCVTPGLVLTDMILENMEKVSQQTGVPAEEFIAMAEKSPQFNHVGRATKTDEVAEVVAFLASEASSSITGEVINLNGGWF
jgi:3-oxoacyl-[acyl-carrier protein] reductase